MRIETTPVDDIPITYELQTLNQMSQVSAIVFAQDPNINPNNIIVNQPIVNSNIVGPPIPVNQVSTTVPYQQNQPTYIQNIGNHNMNNFVNTGNQNNINTPVYNNGNQSTSVYGQNQFASPQQVGNKVQNNTGTPQQKVVPKDNSPLPCDQCGKLYKDAKCLKKHKYVMHNTSGPVNCPHCPKVFTNNYR